MSKFARFMKKNKILKENTTYAPTKSLLDENGEPVKFTIDPVPFHPVFLLPLPGFPSIGTSDLDVSNFASKLKGYRRGYIFRYTNY